MRLCYGIVLLVAPDRVARTLTGSTLDERARVVARVLAARQVFQAVLLITHDRHWLRRAGRATDLLHAASMVLLAALAPGRERVALADALVASALAGPPASPGRGREPVRPEDVGHRDPARVARLGDGDGAEGVDVEEPPGARSRRERHADLQQAIYLTLQDADGARPADIRAALGRNLAQYGLSHPGDLWLEAVTSDLARGKLYVVNGTAVQDIGVRVHRGEPL